MWQPNKLELERLEKAARLEEKGIALYPPRAARTHTIAAAVQAYRQAGDEQAVQVTVTGRVRRLNSKGKVAFLHIEDETGRVQRFCG